MSSKRGWRRNLHPPHVKFYLLLTETPTSPAHHPVNHWSLQSFLCTIHLKLPMVVRLLIGGQAHCYGVTITESSKLLRFMSEHDKHNSDIPFALSAGNEVLLVFTILGLPRCRRKFESHCSTSNAVPYFRLYLIPKKKSTRCSLISRANVINRAKSIWKSDRYAFQLCSSVSFVSQKLLIRFTALKIFWKGNCGWDHLHQHTLPIAVPFGNYIDLFYGTVKELGRNMKRSLKSSSGATIILFCSLFPSLGGMRRRFYSSLTHSGHEDWPHPGLLLYHFSDVYCLLVSTGLILFQVCSCDAININFNINYRLKMGRTEAMRGP